MTTPAVGGFSAFRIVAATLAAAALSVGCQEERTESIPGPAAKVATDTPAKARKPALPWTYERVGSFPSGLTELKGIAIDGRDRIYLAGAEGIRVVDAEGTLLRSLTTSGPAVAVAVDADGNVYAAMAHKIEKHDAAGKRIATWGKQGGGSGELGYVTGIAVHGVNVYVADAGNRCIHRFAADGDFIATIGERDPDAGVPGIVCPSPYLDCAVDAEGNLLVTNPGRLRVERYRPDGELLGHWGEPGSKPGQFSGCCNPTNVALLSDGRVVIGDKLPPRVKVYDGKGKLLAHIGQEHFAADAAGLDLAVDAKGRLFVIDPESGKVLVFARKE